MTVTSLGTATTDAARFGGKAAGLGRLIALGHTVPAGFALPVDALATTLSHLAVDDELEALNRSMRAGEPDLTAADRIRRALLDAKLRPDLAAEVREAAASLHDARLIVRSSAAVEDSTSHSYAGIFESIPVPAIEDLEACILDVWSSVFTPRALTYAVNSGQTHAPDMGVVVQCFIDADYAGVIFTTFRSPRGEDVPVVEYVEGTAEKLVTGQVTPDRLWLDGTAAADGLGTDAIAELSRLAGVLEDQMGRPQDVEWCLLDGTVHVVQSRPITAGFAVTSRPTTSVPPLLTGTGASPRIGSGPAHLAFNVEQALALEPGAVLVTPMTNPDMVVAMRNSAAIVTDVGGMICHAAIVSRELQLPCVVGTGSATETVDRGQVVTVDGVSGHVYDGVVALDVDDSEPTGRDDLWELWQERGAAAPPLVSTIEMLAGVPDHVSAVVLVIDGDLRCDDAGLWRSFGSDDAELPRLLDDYLGQVDGMRRADLEVHVATHGEVPTDAIERAVANGHDEIVAPAGTEATSVLESDVIDARSALPPVRQSIEQLMDLSEAPGPQPGIHEAPMPDVRQRRQSWDLLPEYGRYHHEHGTAQDDGVYPWIEIRPEVLTSPLLKSLVLPGFEMVPRVLGFRDAPPMYTKWRRTRFHVRADAFGRTWAQLVAATWDPRWMEDFLARVRQSYAALGEVVQLFPPDDARAAAASTDHIVALITAWWPRWVEFFALCLFIQAQGERIVFPVLEQTIAANLADLPQPPSGRRWPDTTDVMAPTTPVLSGEFMASIERVRQALDGADLASPQAALDAVAAGAATDVAKTVERHLESWHWMRDRDLLFEPWDTPEQVIQTALKTDVHALPPYEGNLALNRLATSLHADLAAVSGREHTVRHGVRFLQDLNVERENHHILWLKYSYPLRRLVVELERRLVADGVLQPGSVFFLQLPEVLAAIRGADGTGDLAELAVQRRRAYRHESKLEEVDPATLQEEDHYF